MKRLVDRRDTIDPAEARLVDLIRATGKVSVNPFQKRATLHRVLSGATRTLRFGAWGTSLGGVLLVGTAAAGGITWWHHDGRSSRQADARVAPAGASVAEGSAPSPFEPAAEQPLAASFTPMQRSAKTRPLPRGRAAEDPTLVMQAVRALRSDHDPWRAEDLLQSYARAYPRGALSEEVLALQIESAKARNDPSTKQRALRYLRLYPAGVYRPTAEGVLDSRF